MSIIEVRVDEIEYGKLLSEGEFRMQGGTPPDSTVSNSWIPYAVLDGVSIEEVRRQRNLRNESSPRGYLACLPVHLGLSIWDSVFCSFAPLNSRGEVERLKIFRVQNKFTEQDYNLSLYRNLIYIGPCSETLKFRGCRLVLP